MTRIETRVDVMIGRATDEIMDFVGCKAVKNPVMECMGMEIILFILTVPILFGLLCASIACREIEAWRV